MNTNTLVMEFVREFEKISMSKLIQKPYNLTKLKSMAEQLNTSHPDIFSFATDKSDDEFIASISEFIAQTINRVQS